MPGSDLRLLALDGGGVRGLSALIILQELMEKINPDCPPKPCDYFDMIGGTSTGGLIAIMLGRLRMSVEESIDAYLSLSDQIFKKKRHRVTAKGKIQGRFDSEELALAVKKIIKDQGLKEETLFKDDAEKACKVNRFVCATSKETSGTVCLTSYRPQRGNKDLWNSVKIWEASRATSAASSFFDPIAIGRYKEEFVDGGTGANNPIREMWDQAQLEWGPEPLESKVKCVVSIGTGVPSLKPFKDDVLHIGETLLAMAAETGKTTEQFRRERPLLDSTGRYYRFNVVRGLEDIGLEEAKKVKEIAAATRQYVNSQEVHKQMQACAGSIASREYSGEYRTVFSLVGVPQTPQFVDRPIEMEALERTLLPKGEQNRRQKIYVLRGLGGIGKTQLAVEFARRHHRRFSSVFWLDGRSKDALKRSIASCASGIPPGQIAEASRQYTADGTIHVDIVVKDVMAWLARPDNTAWLLIFDNVDREHKEQGGDPDAYDVKQYFSGAVHGSVLVTTRLARLEQLGDSQQLSRVTKAQGQAILESWYKKKHDVAEAEQLLELLDGLPLAIAQAGAYLQESGTDLTTYLRFYKQQWSELMASNQFADTPLQDYPSGSVWTTWAISYQAIREKHEATANLLLLWSFLDNKDLWYGLFARAYSRSPIAAAMLSEWIGDIADSELKFIEAMKLLRNYSLVEEAAETTGYATHPVVHQWAHHSQGKRFETQLSRLAEIAVGWGAPGVYDQDHYAMHRRIFPHAQVCYSWVMNSETIWYRIHEGHNDEELRTFLQALNNLAILYQEQNKSHDAEQLYKRVLREYEEALGPSHISTLNVLNDLGIVYYVQGRLGEAEQMYERALREKEKKLGSSHISTLETVHNLGVVYDVQGRLGEAEQMYERALRGLEKKLGSSHTSTLNTVDNLGTLYCGQGRLGEAEQMYKRALRELEKKLGSSHILTLRTVNNLGVLYNEQNKLEEAEQMHKWALQEKEKVLGSSHILTLQTVSNLGIVYCKQGKLYDAEQMYKRALQGFEELFGSDGIQQHETAFEVLENMGDLYVIKGETSKAQAAYTRALSGLQSVLGESNKRCIDLEAEIKALSLRTQEKEAQPTLQLTEEESLPQLDTEKKSSQFSLRKLIRRKLQ